MINNEKALANNLIFHFKKADQLMITAQFTDKVEAL